MSVELMASAWEALVPVAEKIVLLKIADQCYENGTFKIDQTVSAKACRLDETEFTRCMSTLETDGLLSLTARTYGPSGNVIAHGALTLNQPHLSAQKND